ncbi:uncharacterized protein C22orf15 homolog isoform X3 [Vulpes lagopus]|uniref:uncharacterized protein C22orf15 homolog isoform X3 n=1 Tax=Vulpes lagopus TaxID=494514 RepID=UPI001BC9E7E0|nr:uncharacterized protein C22orf15 homolog isoform X3 [Vulpes lagopus]
MRFVKTWRRVNLTVCASYLNKLDQTRSETEKEREGRPEVRGRAEGERKTASTRKQAWRRPPSRNRSQPQILPYSGSWGLGDQSPHICLLSPAAMFIKVMFGAGCWELMNTWCSLVTFTAHLRQRGQVPPDATIALLAEDGHLVSLDERLEGASQAPSMGSPRLQERGTYVLVKIITPIGKASWAFQRSFTACQDYTPRVMVGGGARAHGVAIRSKAPFQDHAGWAPCHPGHASGGQEPARSPDLAYHGQAAELDSDPRGLAVTSAVCDQAQRAAQGHSSCKI